MIVTNLFTMMRVLNNELDTSAGASDEQSSLDALNMAKAYVETVAATLPRVLSSAGTMQIKTVANKESSPFPSSLLRLDKLWLLDGDGGSPLYPMSKIDDTGDHAPALPWPLTYVVAPTPGQPYRYYADSEQFYWLPKPDQQYFLRAYGLWTREAFVDRRSAFPFPDSLALPIAAFAVKYGSVSLDDPTDDMQKIAVEAFTPALLALRKRDRSAPSSKVYSQVHTT